MGTITVLVFAGITHRLRGHGYLSIEPGRRMCCWPTQTLVFPKQLTRMRKQRERRISDTGQRRVHLVLTTAARISLQFAPLSQQNMEPPEAPESQTGLSQLLNSIMFQLPSSLRHPDFVFLEWKVLSGAGLLLPCLCCCTVGLECKNFTP